MKHPWLIRLLLLAAILAAFGRCLGSDFVDWDDGKLITLNQNIANPTLSGLAHQWNPRDPANVEMYDPVVYTVWWGLAQIAQLQYPDFMGGKLNPEIYHAANLLVHWGTTCLVLQLLLMLGLTPWPAVAAALLFALHPLQVEPVVWATGMKDLLSGFFVMLTLLIYLRAMQRQGPQRRNLYLGATLCFAAALLSKPSTVVVPLIVIVLDCVVFQRPFRPSLLRMLPWLALSAIITLNARFVQQSIASVNTGPPWIRPLVACDAIAFYMAKILLPIHLTIDYTRTPLSVLGSRWNPLLWIWLVPAALAYLLWKLHRPLPTAAFLIFLLGLLPVMGLVKFVFQYYSTVADRYMYVPMLGVALAAGWILMRFGNRIVWTVASLLLAACLGLSFAQAGVWSDSETLFTHGLALEPAAGLHYLILGEYNDKLAHLSFDKAVQAGKNHNAQDYNQQMQLVWVYLNRAMGYYHEAILHDPLHGEQYDHLSADLGRLQQYKQAIHVLRQWLLVDPQLPAVWQTSPFLIHQALARMYLNDGQVDNAIHQAEIAQKLNWTPEGQELLEQAQKAAAQRSATRP